LPPRRQASPAIQPAPSLTPQLSSPCNPLTHKRFPSARRQSLQWHAICERAGVATHDAAMLNGIDQHLAGPLQALSLRAARAETLSANIANADTPRYKARDFDFPAALRAALGGSGETLPPVHLVRTSSQHLGSLSGSSLPVALQYRVPVQGSIDGNTVELDTELGQFSDNALRMQADLTFLSSRFRLLQTAITGQ
jgi:flagellar basal-body rod protein FlgB